MVTAILVLLMALLLGSSIMSGIALLLTKAGLALAIVVAVWFEGRAGKLKLKVEARHVAAAAIGVFTIAFAGDFMALFPRTTTSDILGSLGLVVMLGIAVALVQRPPKGGTEKV